MKVILLEDITDVGKKFEIKEIKDGHVRNFLLPKNLVKPATRENLLWLKKQKEIWATQMEGELKKSQELASKLDGMELALNLKLGDKGQLFESVNAQKIAEKLNEMGFSVKKSQIKLQMPLREPGEFNVKVNLDHGLEVEIKVVIAGEEKTREVE